MLAEGVIDVVREVLAADPTTCDATSLTALAADVQRLRCWLAGDAARLSRVGDAGGRRSTRGDVICDGRDPRRCPTSTALAAATLSAGHADAIARAANRLDDSERVELAARAPELVGQAASMSVERSPERSATSPDGSPATRVCVTTRNSAHSGRCDGGPTATACATPRSALDPENDARFSASFDAAVAAEQAKPDDGRSFDQLRADAFMAMATPDPRRATSGRAAGAGLAPSTRPPTPPPPPPPLSPLHQRPPRAGRVRDLRRPTTPTRHGSTDGL